METPCSAPTCREKQSHSIFHFLSCSTPVARGAPISFTIHKGTDLLTHFTKTVRGTGVVVLLVDLREKRNSSIFHSSCSIPMVKGAPDEREKQNPFILHFFLVFHSCGKGSTTSERETDKSKFVILWSNIPNTNNKIDQSRLIRVVFYQNSKYSNPRQKIWIRSKNIWICRWLTKGHGMPKKFG